MGPTSEEAEEDRHNFAQARDGAKLVAANKEAKKAAAVLDDDSDTFCKNECKADKWLILELSQVAKIDTVELSQVIHYLTSLLRRWALSFRGALQCAVLLARLCTSSRAVQVLVRRSDCGPGKILLLQASPVPCTFLNCSGALQFELYSSRVNEFEVRGRQHHPRHDGVDYAKGLNSTAWRLLGRYEAANSKGTQVSCKCMLELGYPDQVAA